MLRCFATTPFPDGAAVCLFVRQNEEMCLHLQAVSALADRWEGRFAEQYKWFKENWM